MNSELENYYREYGKKVYLFLMSLSGDSDISEELTQETFYQAIKSINRFEGKCSVYTWLCQIAKNLWCRELDCRKRYPVSEYDANARSPSANPEEIISLKDEKMNVLKRLHTLPEHEKEIILLRASGELSFREIGEIFSKSENWARVTYYRAKQKLKKE
ncbi:MAG: sigma-70 family RNA polymerase sigma factor [Oscillospiraceae bacterium]|nr:sigma-70 family RNA polymerase sigma factor [Oscillospiraceae bacterium]